VRSTTGQNRAIRRVQAMLCISDISLYITYIVFLSVNTSYGQVPNNVYCQANGAMIHFVCTSNFTTITYAVYDRYYRLTRMRDDRGKAAGKLVVPPHEKVFKCVERKLRLIDTVLSCPSLPPLPDSSFCPRRTPPAQVPSPPFPPPPRSPPRSHLRRLRHLPPEAQRIPLLRRGRPQDPGARPIPGG
jgi:hypothetical protein